MDRRGKEERIDEILRDASKPCGPGKTRMRYELFRWAMKERYDIDLGTIEATEGDVRDGKPMPVDLRKPLDTES